MKVSSLLFGALLAVASVEAAAIPVADASPSSLLDFCNRSAQPCSKLKRAAEALAEADPEADPARFHHHPCYRNGQPCIKAKRDALALAAAVADAMAEAEAEPEAESDRCESSIPSSR